ncbi:Golgi transport complex subunit COG3 [Sporobolomyces salmoneus]|uniref:Golgi transport complex subunit COG3 n=1 Tax=Sporobolomyces salmoneus TaxID=183962 RepID=UPI00317FB2E9
MASSRASTSRLSLEDWDALSPLSATEIASVQKVNQAASVRPIPHHLKAVQTPLGRLSSSNSPTCSPRPLSSSSNGPFQPSSSSNVNPSSTLHPSTPIESLQQFHDWFSSVESSIEHSQEQVYREHLESLSSHLQLCDSILSNLDESRGLISEMEANYLFVEENSRALQMACETMLDEQKHLLEVTEAIGTRLEYFRELEKATKTLNLPGEELVLKEDFLNMIDRLDVCLDYLKANRDFRDAEIYLIRFQQCLTRAMTLIKMYFVSTIRKITLDAAEKMTGKELSDTALEALLYQKFESPSSSLRILLIELEKRSESDPNEYSSLRSECFTVWFTARSQLLSPGLAEEVRRMEPGSTELVRLAKMGCGHLRGVCINEWGLYKQYFSTGENEVYQFLENLCDHLYDSLRPRILHEPRLEVLCELCTVLQAMMALDADTGLVEASDDSDDDDLFSPSPNDNDPDASLSMTRQSTIQPSSHPQQLRLGRLRFSVLLRTILQDTQTRLVFRAQAVIQSQVLHYVPTPEDLDYPAILEKKASATNEKKESLWNVEDSQEEERNFTNGGGGGDKEKRFRVPNENQMKSWFPTLRRTVWVLARLNAFINTAIFEDFAGEAVTLCQQSLLAAAAQISAATKDVSNSKTASALSGSSQLDGQLFLVRHLLLLKETVRSVDLVHIERAADFSSVTDMLSNILRNTSAIFNPAALFQMASRGIPNFAETMVDAKTDLDSALKKACEDLITTTSLSLTSSIQYFLDRCTSFLSSPSPSTGGSSSSRDLSAQEWATPEEVMKLHQEFQDGLVENVKAVSGKMRLYLEEEKTVKVLLPPLLEEIVETYTTFFNLTRSEYGFATSSSLLPPADVKEKLRRATTVLR